MSNVYVHFSLISFPARYLVVNFRLESHSLRFRAVIFICRNLLNFSLCNSILVKCINPDIQRSVFYKSTYPLAVLSEYHIAVIQLVRRIGHLVELAPADAYNPRYSKWNYAALPILPESWQYQVLPDTKKQFETLKSLMNRADVTP